jgi:fluoride exporter
VRIGLVVGVVGGYTTFSTFAQETFELGEVHHVAVAFAYVAASMILGLAAVYAGTLAGRAL